MSAPDLSACSTCGKRFQHAGGRAIVYDAAGVALRAEHLPGGCRVKGWLFGVNLSPRPTHPAPVWEPAECTTPGSVEVPHE